MPASVSVSNGTQKGTPYRRGKGTPQWPRDRLVPVANERARYISALKKSWSPEPTTVRGAPLGQTDGTGDMLASGRAIGMAELHAQKKPGDGTSPGCFEGPDGRRAVPLEQADFDARLRGSRTGAGAERTLSARRSSRYQRNALTGERTASPSLEPGPAMCSGATRISRGTDGLQTRRWREPDSNPRSRFRYSPWKRKRPATTVRRPDQLGDRSFVNLMGQSPRPTFASAALSNIG